jgi:hypothetical protein
MRDGRHIRRWHGAVCLVAMVLVTGGASGGTSSRPYRVAILATGIITAPIMAGLRERLAQLGYAEGTALTFLIEGTQGGGGLL